MLESVLPYRDVFKRLEEEDSSYKHKPSDDEWENAATVCKFLKRFYDVTKLFCGVDYPAIHLFLKEISTIKKVILGGTISTEYFLSSMCYKMLSKFDEYWSDIPVTYDIALILDPRYKRKLLKFYLAQLHGRELGALRFERTIALMQLLFDQYKNKISPVVDRASTEVVIPSNDEEEIQQWLEEEGYAANNDSDKSELELYFGGSLENKDTDLDILSWWKVNSTKFPILAAMAQDILVVPITTAASESAFSTGGRILDQYKSSLLPETVECLICTQDWLRDKTVVGSFDDLDDEFNSDKSEIIGIRIADS